MDFAREAAYQEEAAEYAEEDPTEVYTGLHREEAPEEIRPEDVRTEEQENRDFYHQRKYSLFAKAAYDYNFNGFDSAQEELHNFLPNYDLVPEYSDNHSVVVRNNKTNEISIAYRGTDFKNPTDLLADIALQRPPMEGHGISAGLTSLIGKVSPGSYRFIEAQNKYDAVRQAFPNDRVTVTGHSLGAAQSLLVARNNNLKGFHFAPFERQIQVLGPTSDPDYKPQTIFTTGWDKLALHGYRAERGKDRVLDVHRHIPLWGQGEHGEQSAWDVSTFIGHGLNYFLPLRAFDARYEDHIEPTSDYVPRPVMQEPYNYRGSSSSNWLFPVHPGDQSRSKNTVNFQELKSYSLCKEYPNSIGCPRTKFKPLPQRQRGR